MDWSLGFHRWKWHVKPMKRRHKRQKPKKITRDNSTGDKADCDQGGLQEEAGLMGGCRGKVTTGQVSMGTRLFLLT